MIMQRNEQERFITPPPPTKPYLVHKLMYYLYLVSSKQLYFREDLLNPPRPLPSAPAGVSYKLNTFSLNISKLPITYYAAAHIYLLILRSSPSHYPFNPPLQYYLIILGSSPSHYPFNPPLQYYLIILGSSPSHYP